MADIIQSFGNYICKNVSTHPKRCKDLLLTAYRANGLGTSLSPERRLPPSRRYGVKLINDAVVRMLSHSKESALVSVFMPCELLHTLDITPMCAEMYSSYINGTKCESVFATAAEANGISESYCSYHKVLVGSAYSGVLPAPAMAVNCSLICDANNLTFKELAGHFDIPHFYIDVPIHRDEESVGYVADQLRELAVFLQDHTHRSLDEDKLATIIKRSDETISLLNESLHLKRTHYLPTSIVTELNEIYVTHNALGTESALKYAEMLRNDLMHAPEKNATRILWMYAIPIWQEPVKELFNFNEELQITACDMNLDCLIPQDPLKPYESMARRLVYSSFNGGKSRVQAAIENARAIDAAGAVCFCNWGCKQSMGISYMLKEEMEAAGIPVLILNGDACDRRNASDGQVATRLNAFVEMLKDHG